jgi:hypothetical protein
MTSQLIDILVTPIKELRFSTKNGISVGQIRDDGGPGRKTGSVGQNGTQGAIAAETATPTIARMIFSTTLRRQVDWSYGTLLAMKFL